MTASGYPAIISEVNSSKMHGLVVSPGGPVTASWDGEGKNQSNLREFYDLKYAPGIISDTHVILKKGMLIGTAREFEDAKRTGELNGADLVSKLSDLKVEMFR